MMNAQEIIKELKESILQVSFDKVDGSSRSMRCTLRKDFLPPATEEELKEYDEWHIKNPEVVAVWDIEKNGWRSFRVDSVKYVQVIEGI